MSVHLISEEPVLLKQKTDSGEKWEIRCRGCFGVRLRELGVPHQETWALCADSRMTGVFYRQGLVVRKPLKQHAFHLVGENVPQAKTASRLLMLLRTNKVCPSGNAMDAPQQKGGGFDTLPL